MTNIFFATACSCVRLLRRALGSGLFHFYLISRVVISVAAVDFVLAAEPLSPALSSPKPTGLPQALPYNGGWLGGDVGSSLLLPDGRVLWIFGDSFIGGHTKDCDRKNNRTDSVSTCDDSTTAYNNSSGFKNRRQSVFIHNSVGLSNSKGRRFDINYHWGKSSSGEPQSFFMGRYEENKNVYPVVGLPHEFASQKYYWPLSTFFVYDKIFVVLVRVEMLADGDFGFKETGVDLVEINNWREPISQWRQKYISFYRSETIVPAAAAVQDGDWIYFLTYFKVGMSQVNTLARLPISIFKNLPEEDASLKNDIQFLQLNGEFTAHADASSLKIILDPGNSEASLFKDGNVWKVVYTHRNRALQLLAEKQKALQPEPIPEEGVTKPMADEIVIQWADELVGPWSAPQLLVKPSETDPESNIFSPAAFSYAAKVHPWAESDYTLSPWLTYPLTYVVNTLDPILVYDRLDFYTPVRPTK